MRAFLAALQFLTVCPVPARYQCGEKELAQSVVYFPVVGLLLGIALAALDYALSFFLPPLPASMLVVIAMMGVSGNMHMDGVADTADGFLSARPRERMLEIMRDSRVGAMGAVVVAATVVLKWAALASVPPSLRVSTILLMPLAGRGAQILGMIVLPYARANGGMAGLFTQRKPWSALAVSAVVLGALAFYTQGVVAGGITLVAVIAAVLLFSRWCWGKIGGFTGDTLGAGCELAEITVALVTVALAYRGILR